MYTKQEASAIRQQFWTTLGKYLLPIPSASGNKINWINYKTGIKNIRFKMDAVNKEAIVRIEIRGDEEKRASTYIHFNALKNQFYSFFKDEYTWMQNTIDEHGKPLSCIYLIKENLNIFNKADWPALISFFKENAIAFDNFWTDYKEIFEMQTQ